MQQLGQGESKPTKVWYEIFFLIFLCLCYHNAESLFYFVHTKHKVYFIGWSLHFFFVYLNFFGIWTIIKSIKIEAAVSQPKHIVMRHAEKLSTAADLHNPCLDQRGKHPASKDQSTYKLTCRQHGTKVLGDRMFVQWSE